MLKKFDVDGEKKLPEPLTLPDVIGAVAVAVEEDKLDVVVDDAMVDDGESDDADDEEDAFLFAYFGLDAIMSLRIFEISRIKHTVIHCHNGWSAP